MYKDSSQRPGSLSEQRMFDRLRFGKILKEYVTLRAKSEAKEFVEQIRQIAEQYGKNVFGEPCTLHFLIIHKEG